jgi:hypothetical protein
VRLGARQQFARHTQIAIVADFEQRHLRHPSEPRSTQADPSPVDQQNSLYSTLSPNTGLVEGLPDTGQRLDSGTSQIAESSPSPRTSKSLRVVVVTPIAQASVGALSAVKCCAILDVRTPPVLSLIDTPLTDWPGPRQSASPPPLEESR